MLILCAYLPTHLRRFRITISPKPKEEKRIVSVRFEPFSFISIFKVHKKKQQVTEKFIVPELGCKSGARTRNPLELYSRLFIPETPTLTEPDHYHGEDIIAGLFTICNVKYDILKYQRSS